MELEFISLLELLAVLLGCEDYGISLSSSLLAPSLRVHSVLVPFRPADARFRSRRHTLIKGRMGPDDGTRFESFFDLLFKIFMFVNIVWSQSNPSNQKDSFRSKKDFFSCLAVQFSVNPVWLGGLRSYQELSGLSIADGGLRIADGRLPKS